MDAPAPLLRLRSQPRTSDLNQSTGAPGRGLVNSNRTKRRMLEFRSLSVTRTQPASRHDNANRMSLPNDFEIRAISKPSCCAISASRSPERCQASADLHSLHRVPKQLGTLASNLRGRMDERVHQRGSGRLSADSRKRVCGLNPVRGFPGPASESPPMEGRARSGDFTFELLHEDRCPSSREGPPKTPEHRERLGPGQPRRRRRW
jgi:hypothetical protein